MTTSKYEESIKELVSTDDAKRLKALRFIKNSVIGNKTKKDLYIKLGVIERLVEYLNMSGPEAYGLKIQAATILGSIAYGKDENAISVVSFGALGPLLNSLRLPQNANLTETIHQHRKLLEASTRALKAIFSSHKVPKEQLFKTW
ncbi:hypothetical protein CLU79DRAFT_423968 [Phycomyces nitens]|nr:hypothetical protein CLU79DRAFT_423968 [Phycomyces nitens]